MPDKGIYLLGSSLYAHNLIYSPNGEPFLYIVFLVLPLKDHNLYSVIKNYKISHVHSIRQVRNMCTKILWLQKGEQRTFSDDVQSVCNQDEEFLSK